MADKAISELVAAPSVTPDSLFVLQQDGTAKKLTAQVLENWLVSFADGHGGIQSYELLKTVGLVKTYRFTLADQTPIDIDVVDGRGIESVKPTSTNGLVDTYTITYNDGTKSTFTVTNGAKGDKGDNAYTHIKFASQEPTEASHSFGDVPDKWIGFYWGNSSTAPTDWTQYKWYQFKGDKGDTGEPATLVSSEVRYQVSDSGTIIPSGSWSTSIPVVAQGKYLWTRTTNNFNTGNPVVYYSVSRMGLDGSGSVSSVANISPDANGNVPLNAADVKGLPIDGGIMEGPINMNGQPIGGLNMPTENDQAANMGFVNERVRESAPRNLLDNSDFRNPVNQRGVTDTNGRGVYTIDRWMIDSENGNGYFDVKPGVGIGLNVNGDSWMTFVQRISGLDQNKQYTIAFMDGAGIIYVNESSDILWGNGYGEVRLILNAATRTIVWAALYEGEYTAETLPKYQPKEHGTELAECQRYYQEYGAGLICLWENNELWIVFPFVNMMRAKPETVTLLKTNIPLFSYGAGTGGDLNLNDCTLAIASTSENGASAIVIHGTPSTTFNTGMYRYNSNDSVLAFSADFL